MNTKHFHKDTARFKLLMDSVEKEINNYIRKIIKTKLLKIDNDKFNLSLLMSELAYGEQAAKTFENEYKQIKKDVKEENNELSWEDSPDMFKQTKTTIERVKKLIEKLKDIDAHAILIETELTQVIGDANFLKEAKEATFQMFMIFKDESEKLFDKDNQIAFDKLIKEFDSKMSILDDKIKNAMNEQFKSVRSSIDKFKMLEKFKSIKKVMNKEKDEKEDNIFNEVLNDYNQKELHNYTMIFENHKHNPPVNDTIP